MILNNDTSRQLTEQVKEAYSSKTALQICAGNSKDFYGRTLDYQKLDVSNHTGIINYEPSELMLTVRAGTTLTEINSELAKNNQMLAFEPPSYNANSTIGGTIACGFSGSRRPFAGAARDFILGTRVLNGKGESLRFGGEVIKNVAGYDASRLMTGALGTLGVLLDVSLKILPRPESEITLVQDVSLDSALQLMTHLKRQTYPISGLVYYSDQLFIRLSGSNLSIKNAQRKITGELLQADQHEFNWQDLDTHKLPFFKSEQALWRVSVKPNTVKLDIDGDCLYGWAGAERWIINNSDAIDNNKIFELAASINGHATLFRNGDRNSNIYQPLPTALLKLHTQLKKSFDPNNILNPGKLYSNL